ncbi:MAG: hypothetical protein ACUVXE_10885 [Anaerolineae bacterium]
MSDEPEITAEASPLSEADQGLLTYFKDLEKTSLETIDKAARQVITLVTTLLGLFFGVLAFGDAPAYLTHPGIRALGALTTVLYVAALFLALDVVTPRRVDLPTADLTAMRALLHRLLDRKSRSLLAAQVAFALATLCLLGLILALLIA